MLPSGGSHKQPKSDAGAAETVDEPASEYARLERLVVAFLVCDNALLSYATLGKGSIDESRGRTHVGHLEVLIWPLCMSLMLLYFFGTLDSSAVGRRALVIWVAFWLYQAICMAIFVGSEESVAGAFGYFAFNAFLAAAFGWLINVLRSELRTRGSLDAVTTRITTKLAEIMGLQAALAAIAFSQGIGLKASKRLTATGLFQLSLIMAWLFSTAIFDVSGVDPRLALTKMRLSLVEGAALFCTGIMVLSGFNLYFLSEQSRPKSRTLTIVATIFIFSIIGGFFCTARVVWVARRRRRSKVSDSDPKPPA